MPQIERESINFKLPKSLTTALRKAAKERDTTATELVIQGLHHILGDVPGVENSIEVRLYQLEEEFFRFKESIGETAKPEDGTRLSSIESKLEALSTQLARFEGALMQLQSSVNTGRSRRNSHSPYNAQPLQIGPLDEEKLAMRFSTNVSTLQDRRSTMGKEEFEKWCSERDPSKRKWEYSSKDGLYHLVK